MLKKYTGYKRLLALAALSGGAAPVERTATGNPLTFITDLARPLKSLLIPFTPVQSGTGDPSPQNIRPIIGWDAVNVKRSDGFVEIYGFTAVNINKHNVNNFGLTNDYGTTISAKTRNYPSEKIVVTQSQCGAPESLYSYKNGYFCIVIDDTSLVGKSITVKMDVDIKDNPLNTNVFRIYLNGSGGGDTNIVNGKIQGTWTYVKSDSFPDRQLIEVRNCGVSCEISNIEITLADAETDTYHVTFPSPVYGGTLDVVSGVLTVEWAMQTLIGAEGESWSFTITSSNRYRALFYKAGFENAPKNNSRLLANYMVNSTAGADGNGWFGSTGNFLCYVFEGITTESDWRGYLAEHPLVIAYELEEPQEVTLTTAQLTALVGDNTIWSDADGSMTAVYLVSGKYAEDHPVGGLGSGLLGGGFGSGSGEPDEPGDPDEPGEPDQPDEPAEPDQPVDDQPEEP